MMLTGVSPSPVQVPNIDRLSLADAQAAIEAAGLRVGTISAENSPNIRKDIVIRTDPAVGAEVREARHSIRRCRPVISSCRCW